MPYDASDARSTLPTLPSRVPAATGFSAAEYVRFADQSPGFQDERRRSWYARGQHLVLEYSDIDGETLLTREDHPDEYMVILPDEGVTAAASTSNERAAVPGRSLIVMPPGDSELRVQGVGRVIRLFSSRAADLRDLAVNADSYAEEHRNLAPLEDWPEPVGGFRLRVYDLSLPPLENPRFRLYRSTNMMVNVFDPSDGPRDTTRLSPHSHDDFEQYSLVLEGEFVHHLRWPWTTDLAEWRDDEHELCGSPSLTVIPAQAVHTSQGVAPGQNQLIDIFAPPRADFSAKPGWVLNAADYPMP